MSELTAAALAVFTMALVGCGGTAFTAADLLGSTDSGAPGEATVDPVVAVDSGTDRATEEVNLGEEGSEAGSREDGSLSSGDSPDSGPPSGSDGGSDGGISCDLQICLSCPHGPCCISSTACGCYNATQTTCFPL